MPWFYSYECNEGGCILKGSFASMTVGVTGPVARGSVERSFARLLVCAQRLRPKNGRPGSQTRAR